MRGFQRQIISALANSCCKFDRNNFLKRRVSLTFSVNMCNIRAVDNNIARVVSWLHKCRPVTVYAFLRWCLNSIPTQHRLHDTSPAICPFCGDLHGNIQHLIACNQLFATAREHVLRFVRSGGMQFRSARTSFSAFEFSTNGAHFSQPVEYVCHVCDVLGFLDTSLCNFRQRLLILYVTQHMFTSARRNLSSDVLSSHSRDSPTVEACSAAYLSSLAEAAILTLR